MSKEIGATFRRTDLHYSYSGPRTRRNGWFALARPVADTDEQCAEGCTGPRPIVLKRHTLQHVFFVSRGGLPACMLFEQVPVGP